MSTLEEYLGDIAAYLGGWKVKERFKCMVTFYNLVCPATGTEIEVSTVETTEDYDKDQIFYMLLGNGDAVYISGRKRPEIVAKELKRRLLNNGRS